MNDVLTSVDADIERFSTGIEGAGKDDDMFISAKAIEMINVIKEQNDVGDSFLRIGTRGGGCSGMSYSLGFDTEFNENIDRRFDNTSLDLVVDANSLFYLMGVTLDYVETPEGSGFVFHNPNNAHTCGCHG